MSGTDAGGIAGAAQCQRVVLLLIPSDSHKAARAGLLLTIAATGDQAAVSDYGVVP